MTTDWRKAVTDPREVRLFEALEDPKWQWRTLQALQRVTGMNEAEIGQVVAKYPTLVREGRAKTGERIFTLQERYLKQKPLGVRILDFLSNQSTSTMV